MSLEVSTAADDCISTSVTSKTHDDRAMSVVFSSSAKAMAPLDVSLCHRGRHLYLGIVYFHDNFAGVLVVMHSRLGYSIPREHQVRSSATLFIVICTRLQTLHFRLKHRYTRFLSFKLVDDLFTHRILSID